MAPGRGCVRPGHAGSAVQAQAPVVTTPAPNPSSFYRKTRAAPDGESHRPPGHIASTCPPSCARSGAAADRQNRAYKVLRLAKTIPLPEGDDSGLPAQWRSICGQGRLTVPLRVVLAYPEPLRQDVQSGIPGSPRALQQLRRDPCAKAFLPRRARLHPDSCPASRPALPSRDFGTQGLRWLSRTTTCNIVQMLQMAGRSLRAKDRGKRDPLIPIGGSPPPEPRGRSPPSRTSSRSARGSPVPKIVGGLARPRQRALASTR